MTKKNTEKFIEVKVEFNLVIPKTSKKNAELLMKELTDSINDAADCFDTLLPSFKSVLPRINGGYSYGFNINEITVKDL